MRKPLVLAAAVLTTAGLATFAPASASAANSGDTQSTFTLTGGTGLAIAVPDGSSTPVDLGSATTGAASLSHALGNVTVTDTRGLLVAGWTVTASTTDFTTGGGTADETVPQASVSYAAGVGTPQVGQVGAFVPANLGLPVALGSAAAVGSWTGTGNNTVTWNPTVTVNLLPSQVVGTYTGTITHSVS